MKKIIFFPIIMLMGCLSFKITIPEEPEEMVDFVAICKNINKEDKFDKEIPSELIGKNDSTIFALIKVRNISQILQLQWKWYNPQEKLIKTSKILEVNKNNKFLEFFVAWDSLGNSFFKDFPGKWTVIIFCKEQMIYKKEFEVN